MENTNEKLTIKEKAKEIYRKNKPMINAVVIGVGAVGSWVIVRQLTKREGTHSIEKQLEDTGDGFNWGTIGYYGDGGRWFLEIPETLDRGYKTLDEVVEDIKAGNYDDAELL